MIFFLQPTGKPREHHLGELRPKNFELHKISQDKMTGRVDIPTLAQY